MLGSGQTTPQHIIRNRLALVGDESVSAVTAEPPPGQSGAPTHALLFANTIGVAHVAARRFELAIEWADRTLHDQPRMVSAMRTKVAANAHLGHLDEARAELGRLLAIDPKLTIAAFLRAYAHILAPEVLELWVTGLRLAGLPEE
jgi:Flp pilus assembly protein TadD